MVIGRCLLVHDEVDEFRIRAVEFNILNLLQPIRIIRFLKPNREYSLIDHREVLKMFIFKIEQLMRKI